jgi:hypothetical protein
VCAECHEHIKGFGVRPQVCSDGWKEHVHWGCASVVRNNQKDSFAAEILDWNVGADPAANLFGAESCGGRGVGGHVGGASGNLQKDFQNVLLDGAFEGDHGIFERVAG